MRQGKVWGTPENGAAEGSGGDLPISPLVLQPETPPWRNVYASSFYVDDAFSRQGP